MSAAATAARRLRARLAGPVLATRAALAAAVLFGSMAAVGVASVASAAPPSCTRSWDGGAGTTSWFDAANWDGAGGGQLPTATDHVCIGDGFTVDRDVAVDTSILSLRSLGDLTLSAGSLSLTDTVNASSIEALTQDGGNLGGAATVTITDSLTWNGLAEQTGTGTTVIADGATGTFNGDSLLLRGGRTFDNEGSITWSSGLIQLVDAQTTTTFQNGGSLDIAFDGTFSETCCDGGIPAAPAVLHNTGTIAKTAGDNTASISAPLDNDGAIASQSGALLLQMGNGVSTGSFTDIVFAGFSSVFSLGAGATFSGDIVLDDADLTLGADITVPAGSTFTQRGFSSVLRGAGDLVIEGELDWSWGTQRGPGHTVIAPTATATIDSPSAVTLREGRVF